MDSVVGMRGFPSWMNRILNSILLLAAVVNVRAADQVIPVLMTTTATYSNVTVTTKSKDYIFIHHAGGMGNIRVDDLSDDAKRVLGYSAPPRKYKKVILPVVLARDVLPQVEERLKPIQDSVREQLPPELRDFQPTRPFFVALAAAGVAMHLFFSLLCRLIVLKAKKVPGGLVWIPGLQWIPLLRAAEMSGWWFLLLWFPIVPLVWAFKVVKARGLSILISILLILPVTGIFAFLYLAFAREKPAAPVRPKYESMSLETA